MCIVLFIKSCGGLEFRVCEVCVLYLTTGTPCLVSFQLIQFTNCTKEYVFSGLVRFNHENKQKGGEREGDASP